MSDSETKCERCGDPLVVLDAHGLCRPCASSVLEDVWNLVKDWTGDLPSTPGDCLDELQQVFE